MKALLDGNVPTFVIRTEKQFMQISSRMCIHNKEDKESTSARQEIDFHSNVTRFGNCLCGISDNSQEFEVKVSDKSCDDCSQEDEQDILMLKYEDDQHGLTTAGGITANVGDKMKMTRKYTIVRGASASTNTRMGHRAVRSGILSAVTDSFLTYTQKIGMFVEKLDVKWPVSWIMLTSWMRWPSLGWDLLIMPVKGSWFY